MSVIETVLQKEIAGISKEQTDAFEKYAEFIITENAKYNLTAITDPEEMSYKHFADSVLPIKYGKDFDEKLKVLDIGSGAGLPGIPLKIMKPNIELTVLDATAKKTLFMSNACDLIGADVTSVTARAEEAAGEGKYREQYDIVVSRGVAALNVLCELCIPFVKTGGLFIAYKGKSAEEELAAAGNAIKKLGGRVERKIKAETPAGERELIYIRKSSHTPDEFPRQFSKIKKKPL